MPAAVGDSSLLLGQMSVPAIRHAWPWLLPGVLLQKQGVVSMHAPLLVSMFHASMYQSNGSNAMWSSALLPFGYIHQRLFVVHGLNLRGFCIRCYAIEQNWQVYSVFGG